MCRPDTSLEIQPQALCRPLTLVEGQRYFLLAQYSSRHPSLMPVTFLAYTACPAVVVVTDGSNCRVRCAREDLFG
jgi:hypothetical protein